MGSDGTILYGAVFARRYKAGPVDTERGARATLRSLYVITREDIRGQSDAVVKSNISHLSVP